MLSRRDFLRFAGITTVSAHFLPKLWQFSSSTEHNPVQPFAEVLYGRALRTAVVYAAPTVYAAQTTRLWPDSVVRLLNEVGAWYRIPAGYVLRSDLQPLMLASAQTTLLSPYTWAEVAAPVAVIREWCAADAPLITRVGHSGVLWVMDVLPPTRNGTAWYAVASAENGDLLGWTQAHTLRAVDIPQSFNINLWIALNTHTHQLMAFVGDRPVLTAAFSTGKALPSGSYRVMNKRPAGVAEGGDGCCYHGAPFEMQFAEGNALVGAYWHNQFGEQMAGPAVQVSPILARWLYEWLTPDSTILVY